MAPAFYKTNFVAGMCASQGSTLIISARKEKSVNKYVIHKMLLQIKTLTCWITFSMIFHHVHSYLTLRNAVVLIIEREIPALPVQYVRES